MNAGLAFRGPGQGVEHAGHAPPAPEEAGPPPQLHALAPPVPEGACPPRPRHFFPPRQPHHPSVSGRAPRVQAQEQGL